MSSIFLNRRSPSQPKQPALQTQPPKRHITYLLDRIGYIFKRYSGFSQCGTKLYENTSPEYTNLLNDTKFLCLSDVQISIRTNGKLWNLHRPILSVTVPNLLLGKKIKGNIPEKSEIQILELIYGGQFPVISTFDALVSLLVRFITFFEYV